MARDDTIHEDPGADKARAGIQSVEVGFALLDVLAQAPGALMLRDLAALAGMSAAKAHRYLVSFQRLGLVVQDVATTRYELGPATLRLGLATLSRLDAVKMARERLPALGEQTGQTLALAVWGRCCSTSRVRNSAGGSGAGGTSCSPCSKAAICGLIVRLRVWSKSS